MDLYQQKNYYDKPVEENQVIAVYNYLIENGKDLIRDCKNGEYQSQSKEYPELKSFLFEYIFFKSLEA